MLRKLNEGINVPSSQGSPTPREIRFSSNKTSGALTPGIKLHRIKVPWSRGSPTPWRPIPLSLL